MESYFANLDVEELDFDTTAEERNRKVTRGNQSKVDPSERARSSPKPLRSHASSTASVPQSSDNYCDACCDEEEDDTDSDEELETSSSSQAKRKHYSQRLGRYIELGQVRLMLLFELFDR